DAEIRTDLFRTPLAVEWGDMNGDGRLDLAVADSPPRVYEYRSGVFSPILSLPLDAVGGQVWELGIVDQDNEGDLDLAVSNRDGPSMLFSNFAPLLSPGLSQITGTGSTAAASVAWGDAEGDGDLDLLFGASQTTVGARLYHNVQGTFPAADIVPYLASGFGPHTVAFGDVDGDTRLDVALGLGTTAGLQVYLAGHTDAPDWTSAAPHYPNHNIAWGDADDDGDLDLLAGRDGPNALYVNRDGQLESVPRWTSATIYDSRSIAWGDYNGDRYLDFAVGNDGQPNELYRNNRDNTFSRVWIAPDLFNTRSVAWGDYDGDGDLDLAVGNYGQANLIYENAGGSLGTTPAWQSAFVRHTTSLAWGDWDNDGDLDLAVGNDGEPDQVYANLNSQPGATPQLYWLWASSEAQRTSGLAWGDGDGDGDLDLAVSHRSGGPNGIYQNNYVRPSHLSDDFVQTMPLPNNPTYLAVARPGQTDGAYGYSSAELLSGPKNPTVTVPYKLFDPDGTRQDTPPTNLPGDRVLSTTYEFSLDGGASWQAATPLGTENPTTTTLRLGQSATFLWDAVADAAISDNARFRISTIQQNGTDPAQRGTIRAISPPFRVRGTTCVWPRDPAIEVSIPTPEPGQTVRLAGTVAEASGILTYTWDFGDGSSDRGQVVYHTFYNNGTYPVKLTVRSEPCPLAKEVSVTRLLVVGSGIPSIYLPFVAKASTSRAPAPPAPPEAATDVRGSGNSQTPAGDAGLAGASRVAAGTERVRPAAGIGFSRARSGFGMLPITQGTKGINSQPSVSADGQQIAFWSTDDLTRSGSNADGNPEIFIADVGSNGAVTFIQMTQSAGNILGGFNLSPSLSDDGTRVALFSDRDLTGQGINLDSNFEIFWAAVGSPAPEQLTRTDVGANTLPSLSGDGNRVAFASDRNLAADNGDYNQEIFVYDAALDDFIQVTNTPRTVLNDQPAANVDGSRIAFTSNGELFVAGVTADGNVTLTPLPNPTGQSNRQPAISADGKTITFLSGGDVFVTEIGPGGSMTTTQITDSPGAFIDEPAISADGTRVAFVSDGGIFFFDKEADLLSQISDVTNAQHPSLSADGTILAYVSNREIWITNAPRTDLAANKTSEPQPLVPGRPLTYTIVITNFGPTDAISATVIDAIPAAVKRPVWTCTAAGGSTCQDGSGNLISDTVHVLVGTTITYVITGSAAPWLKGDLVNTVVVSTPPGIVDWRPSNNLSTDVGSSLPEADLGLAKTVDVPIPNEGEPVHFVLVATNGGPSDAQSTLVTDTLPAGLTYAGSAATLGSYSGDIWTLGTLPAETSATLTLTATVDVGSGGMVITNTARGPRAIGTDPNPGNNNASATLTVNAPPRARDDLATTREDQPVPVDVLANDDDPEGALDPTTLVTVTQPASGTLLLNPPSGIITYTPYLNFHGTDGFLYRICDTSGSCATAAVTLTVTAINDPPVASNDTYAVDEDDLLVVVAPGVLGNDVEPDGTPLTATLSGGVSHGSLRFQADGSF
ncbi:MAG: FG-GAP-like repeat-containing protein, partial [Anaerolineae bacterium]